MITTNLAQGSRSKLLVGAVVLGQALALTGCNLKKAKTDQARTEAQAQTDVSEANRREVRAREIAAALAEQSQVIALYQSIEGIYEGEMRLTESPYQTASRASVAAIDVVVTFEVTGLPAALPVSATGVALREREAGEIILATSQIALKATVRERVPAVSTHYACSVSGLKVDSVTGFLAFSCSHNSGTGPVTVDYKTYFSSRTASEMTLLDDSKIQDESLSLLSGRTSTPVQAVQIRRRSSAGPVFEGQVQKVEAQESL